MWSANSGGVFQSGGDNLVYYKKYNVMQKFTGIRVYNKTIGYSTIVPFDFLDDIISFEMMGFQRLAVYQGQVYVLHIEEEATSGIWMLRSPSYVWEKLYSVPKLEVLKYYLFLIVIFVYKIIVSGDKCVMHDNTMEIPENPFEMAPKELKNLYFWMLDRAQGTWIDMANPELDSNMWSQILFEMRLDA